MKLHIYFSFSSFFITIVMSTINILFFNFLMSNHKIYQHLRLDGLTVIVITCVIRLFLPIEFPFTKTIVLPEIMNPIIEFKNFDVYKTYNISHIFILIWIVGIVIMFIKYCFDLHNQKNICEYIKSESNPIPLSKYIESDREYSIYFSELINFPMVLGFQKNIFIPKGIYDKQKLRYILIHEKQHIDNYDIFIKQLINILVIIYWWFPIIYILKKKINLYLEMRVDNQIVNELTDTNMIEYAKILIDVNELNYKNKTNIKFNSSISNFLIEDNKNILEYRIRYLLAGSFRKKTNMLLLIILMTLPFASNSLVLESYFQTPKNIVSDYLTIDDIVDKGYLLHKKDGSWMLVIGDTKITIDNVNELNISLMKVVEE